MRTRSHRGRTWLRLLATGAVGFAFLLSGCGGSTTASTGTTSGAAAELPASQCDKTTGLTVYSAQGYDSDATNAFQQQTGITTKLVDDSTGPLLAKVAAEGANPQWDVLWFDGNVTMQDVDNQGYLLKWKSNNLGNYTTRGRALVPSDYAYYPSGLTAAGVIVYNKAHAPATLPADWSDLTKPQYKNMTAENDPAFSGPAYPFIAGVSQVLGGEAQGKQFFTQLKANGVTIFQTNDPTLSSIKTGAKEFGIIQDSAYFGAAAGGETNLGVIYPSSGVAALPGELSVGANSPHKACAEQFVDWVISQAGQSVMTHHDPTDGDTYFINLITGVTPVVQRQTTGINFVQLDVQKWASVENEYKAWFHSNIVTGS
jgi:iron(III) transport system substrate-binding protein